MTTISWAVLFNDAYHFMDWLLTALLRLIEILVMKLVFILGRMTFTAAYRHTRIFNTREDVHLYLVRTR